MEGGSAKGWVEVDVDVGREVEWVEEGLEEWGAKTEAAGDAKVVGWPLPSGVVCTEGETCVGREGEAVEEGAKEGVKEGWGAGGRAKGVETTEEGWEEGAGTWKFSSVEEILS